MANHVTVRPTPGLEQRGVAVLRDPLLNKGTAFTQKERDRLGLRGLLPPHVHTQETQAQRYLAHLRDLQNPLEKFIDLNALHDRNEALFFRVVSENPDEIMPLIYTPRSGPRARSSAISSNLRRGFSFTPTTEARSPRCSRNGPTPT